jgi:enoyl-CoA hydratase/carnithine racemase
MRLRLYIIRRHMPIEHTLYTVADHVATITLNRLDKLNARTATMEEEVRSAIREAEADDRVRVVVFTGK